MKKQAKKMNGKTIRTLSALALLGALCGGCSAKNTDEALMETQNNVSEMGHRVEVIEGRVQALGQEVHASQDRVYDVYSRNGKKTGMVARPGAMAEKPVAYASPVSNTPAPRHMPVGQSPARAATKPVPQSPVTPAPLPSAQTGTTPKAPLGSLDPNSKMAITPATPQTQPPAQDNALASLSLPPETAMYIPTTPTQNGQNGQGVTTAPTQPSSFTPPAQAPQASMAQSPIVAQTPQAPVVRATPIAPVAVQKTAPAVAGEKAAYAHALNLVRGGQATAGRAQFEAFLQSYPNSSLVPNAYYWIGESYYSQANYTDALFAFKQVTNNFPKHHKTSDALLKAGLTYQKLGDTANAQMQYRALLADFPSSNAAKIVRNRKL